MEPLSILDIVNKQQQTSYQIVSKFGNGVQGAYTLQDHAGIEYVLKWAAKPELTARLDEALRYTTILDQIGYPLPRYIHIGEALGGKYSIQQKLPGEMCNREDVQLYLPRLLELNELQMGKSQPSNWPEPIVHAVIFGGTEFCPHEPLLQHSTASAELLTVLQRTVSTYERHSYRTSDIVHFDFHHQNLLVHEGKLSGVVDWQFPCTGDATFDLVTLMLYSEPDSETWMRLYTIALERVGKEVASLYLAYLLLRQVNWCIEHWPAWLEHWYKIAYKMLT